MSKYSITVMYFVIVFLMQGCVQQVPTKPTVVPHASITERPIVVSPTFSVTEPFTPTPSYTDKAHFQTNCLNVNPAISSGQLLNGAIVFGNQRMIANGRHAPGVFLFDLTNQSQTQIDKEGEHLLDIQESPDRTHVVYQLVKGEVSLDSFSLIVATSDFQQKKTFAWKEEWGGILGWADNTHIILSKFVHRDLHDPVKPPELIIFDINTLKEYIVKPDFPDIYDDPTLSWAVAYDPSFTHAVYMHWRDSSHILYDFALWDMKKHELLTTQPIVEYPIPKWSPDGSQFISTRFIDLDPGELYSINSDGKINRLTFLSNYFSHMEIVNYSWSPNSRRVALLFIKQLGDTVATLATLDIDTGIVTNHCVPITLFGSQYENRFAPLWSPNSEQLIVQDVYSPNHRRAILVDIVNNYAAQVAEDLEPLAWLKKP